MKARYYLFGTKEESIAYDILTAHADAYPDDEGKLTSAINHEFKASEDRINAVDLLAKTLAIILKVDRYKALSYDQQKVIDQLLFRALLHRQYLPLYIKQETTRRWSPAEDERGSYAYTTIDFTVTCRVSLTKSPDAMHAIANVIYPELLQHYPHLCRTKPATHLTLMCIKQFHANSLFGKLPKEIATIIAKDVKAKNDLIFKK